MAKGQRTKKDIVGLPPGWKSYAKGEKQWITSRGNISDERHAEGPGGATLSWRQVQNQQRATRAASGQPKAPTISRTGKKRTIYKKESETYANRSLFGSAARGNEIKISFDSFASARNYIIQNGVPEGFKYGLLQIKYTNRLRGANKPGSPPVGSKNGYATISPFRDAEGDESQFVQEARDQTIGTPEHPNVWNEAEARLADYDMSGKNARVYIYFTEN